MFAYFIFSAVEVERRTFEPVSSQWQEETMRLLGLSAPSRNVWEGVQQYELPSREPMVLLDVGKDGNCLCMYLCNFSFVSERSVAP